MDALPKEKKKLAADFVVVVELLWQARDLFRDTFGGEATVAAAAPGRY